MPADPAKLRELASLVSGICRTDGQSRRFGKPGCSPPKTWTRKPIGIERSFVIRSEEETD